MISNSPSGKNKTEMDHNQHGRNLWHVSIVTEKTLYYIIPLSSYLEAFVVMAFFLNEKQIENWARAVARPTMNTGTASPVISLGCGWLWL